MLFFLLMFACVASAAVVNLDNPDKKNGILLIGSREFRTEQYFQRSREIFKVEKNQNVSFEVGEELQKKYADYCQDNAINKNNAPELKELLEFVKQNDFDCILCLVIKDPEISESVKTEYLGFDMTGNVKHFTVSMEVNAFLCDKTKLIKTYTSVKKKDQSSKKSRNPREKAKRGAFTLCISDINKAMKKLW